MLEICSRTGVNPQIAPSRRRRIAWNARGRPDDESPPTSARPPGQRWLLVTYFNDSTVIPERITVATMTMAICGGSGERHFLPLRLEQQELAIRLRVDPGTLARRERGARTPTGEY